MNKMTVKEEWEAFEKLYAEDLAYENSELLKFMKYIFYTGCSSMFTTLMRLNEAPTEEAEKGLIDIKAEIGEYLTEEYLLRQQR